MPSQLSRSAWSVIGWVTSSFPKLNSKISKILAPNFPNSKISKMARPSGQDFPKHKGGNFGNFGNPASERIPKFPKSPPLCFGKSCPLGRAILEISEILEIRKVSEFPKSPPLCFGTSCPLGRAILEISEILEIRKVREFQNFQNSKKSALMFWKILSTRSGHFGNFGNPES